MPEIIGVKFRTVGKVYYFAPNDIAFEVGDGAIVETARGLEYGDVVTANKEVPQSEIVGTLKPVVRKANAKDKEKHLKNEKRKAECMVKAREKIEERKLDMKLKDVEFTFDGSKIIFYFSSESRVDFRELVKDLASIFHARIELRQIGIRDENQNVGRTRSVRQSVLLQSVSQGFRARVDKNGENSGAFAQSRKNQRSLRQAHVLSQIRKQSLYGNSKTYAQGGQRGGYARRTRPR